MKATKRGHSPAGDGRGRDKSEYGKKVLREGHSQTEDGRGSDKSGYGKKTDRARGTHRLEMAEGGGGGQDTDRNRPSEGYSPTADSRERQVRTWKRKRPSERHSPTADG